MLVYRYVRVLKPNVFLKLVFLFNNTLIGPGDMSVVPNYN